MRPGRCGQGDAARAMQPGVHLHVSSSFLLRNACPSVRLKAKLVSEIDTKIDPKSVPEHPRGSESRPKIGPRTHSGRPVALRDVPEPSRSVSGASPASPGSSRRVPKDGPGRPKRRPGTLRRGARRPKSTPSRVRKRKNRVFFARLVREASSDRFFDDFRQFLVFLQSLRTL